MLDNAWVKKELKELLLLTNWTLSKPCGQVPVVVMISSDKKQILLMGNFF